MTPFSVMTHSIVPVKAMKLAGKVKVHPVGHSQPNAGKLMYVAKTSNVCSKLMIRGRGF